MALDPESRNRFNLSKTTVLVLDPSPVGLDILVQILKGFGARQIYRCHTVEEAKSKVLEHQIDLMVVDTVAESGEGYDFVRWLRKGVPEPNRHAPVLLTAAHTRASDVASARDCGSHFIVTKPLAPTVVLERIIWISREGRAFVLSDGYIGPDRRFARPDDTADHPRRRFDDRPRATEAPASESDDGSTPFLDRPLKAAS